MPNLGSLFSGIAQGYAQGIHQQRQEALAKQAQEQQAAYQQAQIKIAGAQAVLNDPNADAAKKEAAQATIQEAISQIGQTGQQGGRGKGGKKGSAGQENPLAKIFALLQGHQGGGQAPPIPAPPAQAPTSASASQASAPPATPPIPAPSAAAQNGSNGGSRGPTTPPVPQPPAYLSGPGGLDRQRQQAEFDMQEAQRLQQLKDTIELMKAQGATPTQINEAVFHVPATPASLAIPHQVSSHISSTGLPQDAHLQDGTPIQGNPSFDKNTIWNAMAQFNPETGSFDFYYEPVGAPQQSPNSALGQLTQAFRTLQTADPASPEARAAADVVAKADPSRVRVTSTERTITITNPDGSTHVVTIPITSTSATAPGGRGGGGSPKLPPLPSAGAGAASPVSGTGGHKALPAQEARQVESASNLITMAEAVKAAIAQAGQGADDNSIMTAIKNRLKSAQYRAGFAVDTNKISNFSGLMQAMVASTVGTGRLNQRLLDIAEQHVPATGMTPAAMLERISNMEEAARDVRQGVLSTRGLALGPDGRLINAPASNGGKAGKTGDPAVDRLLQQMGIGGRAGGGGGA